MEASFVPKLKKAFADAGIAIEDSNGELRSTYDVLEDLAGKWDTLSSKQRQYLGEKVAGNRQVKVLNAIMANWSTVEETIDNANNATGAATEGNEKYLNSIQGRITAFQSAFQDLSRTTINSDWVKGFIQIGTSLTNFTTSIGGLAPVIGAISGVILAWKGAKITEGVNGFFSGIGKTFGKGGGSSFLGAIGAIGTSIIVAKTALDKIDEALRSDNRLESSKQSYNNAVSKVESIQSEIEGNEAQIASLQSSKELNSAQQQDLLALQARNNELKNQLELQKQIVEVQKQAAQQDFTQFISDFSRGSTGSWVSDMGNGFKELGADIIDGWTSLWGTLAGASQDEINSVVDSTSKQLGSNLWGLSGQDLFAENIKQAQVEAEYISDQRKQLMKEAEKSLAKGKMPVLNGTGENIIGDLRASQSNMAQNLLSASQQYSQLQKATEGIERNALTEPYFRYVEEMGDALQKQIGIYQQIKEENDAFVDNILSTDAYKSVSSDLLKMAQSGELTSEVFSNLSDTSRMGSFINVCNALGISAQDVVYHMYDLVTATEKVEETQQSGVKSFAEIAEESYKASDAYKALTSAMDEQQKSGVISLETYKTLMDNADLAAFFNNTADALTLSANGLVLNTDALQNYIKTQQENERINAIEGILKQREALKEYGKELEKLEEQNKKNPMNPFEYERKKNDIQDNINASQNEIDALTAYVREIENANNALSRYSAAKAAANDDAEHTIGQDAYKTLKEGIKSGKIGTDDFKEATNFLLGDDWESRFGSREEAQKVAKKMGERYFGDNDKTSATNFINDLVKGFKDENGNITKFMSLDKATGEIQMLTHEVQNANGELEQVPYTMSEIASAIGTSTSAVQTMFGLLQTFGYEFEMPEVVSPEDQAAIEQRRKDIEETTAAIEKQQENLKGVNEQIDEIGKNGGDITQLEKRRNAIQQNIDALEKHRTELEGGTEQDTSGLTLEDAQAKLLELDAAIQTMSAEGVEIPVSFVLKANALTEMFPQLGTLLTQPEVPQNEPIEATSGSTSSGIKTETANKKEESKNQITNEQREAVSNVVESASNIVQSAGNAFGNWVEEHSKTMQTAIDESLPEERSLAYETPNWSLEHSKTQEIVEDEPIKVPVEAENPATVVEQTQEVVNDIPIKTPITISDEQKQSEIQRRKQEAQEPPATNKTNEWEQGWEDVWGEASSNEGQIESDVTTTIHPQIEESEVQRVPEEIQDVINNNPIQLTPDKMTRNDLDNTSLLGETLISESRNQNPIGSGGFNKANELQTELRNSTFELQNAYTNFQNAVKSGDQTAISNATTELQSRIDNYNAAYSQLSETVSSTTGETSEVDVGLNVDSSDVSSEIESAGAGAEIDADLNVNADNVDVPPVEVNGELNLNTDQAETPEVEDAEANVNFTPVMNGEPPGDESRTLTYNIQTSGSLPGDETRTLTYNIKVNGSVPQFAKGTSNAKEGTSLVDEKGAELIEHTKQGTYELGTNNGPRLTQLEKGDVVHTAEETKKIVSRLGKIGGFFRSGLNQAQSIFSKITSGGAFATGITGGGIGSLFGSTTTSTKKKTTTSTKKSSSKSNDTEVDVVINNTSSTKSSAKDPIKQIKDIKTWAKKLFDWAEIRLERLNHITNEWMESAAESIGYMAKNAQLENALSAVEDEIDANNQAVDLYMNQAAKVAEKANLPDNIVQQIQDGTIAIDEYTDKVQASIKEYQKWYEKAIECKDALTELHKQEEEIATQMLDNVIEHYDFRINKFEGIVRYEESLQKLQAAQGREEFENDYINSIEASTQKLEMLVDQRNALNSTLEDLVREGLIREDSEAWFNYTNKIQEMDQAINDAKTSIIELQDAANNVALTKLGYALDRLTNSASHANEMIDLHKAQGYDDNVSLYVDMIENGMEQIKILEEQNELYRQQQEGLDVLSEKYQELEDNIQSNITEINRMKVSQENWNDSTIDSRIDEIKKFKDSLSKTNDQYQRQKELQEALEDLERARSQRTQRVYREGVGFGFEADQQAVKEAQDKLDDVIENQLLSKMDDLIDALGDLKNDSNVYDAEGNLLGTAYSIPQIDDLSAVLSNYYKNPDISPSMNGLKSLLFDRISSEVGDSISNRNVNLSIGDIIVNEAQNGNELANAIVDQFSSSLLQALYKK